MDEVRVPQGVHPGRCCATGIILLKIIAKLIDDLVVVLSPAEVVHRNAADFRAGNRRSEPGFVGFSSLGPVQSQEPVVHPVEEEAGKIVGDLDAC